MTFPIPGPTLDIADAAAEKAVIKSILKKLKQTEDNKNIQICYQ